MKNILKSIGWVAMNFVLQIAVQFCACICAVAQGITEEAALGIWVMDRLLGVTILSNLLFVLLAWLICRKKEGGIRKGWKLEKPSARDCLMACLAAFAYSMFYNLAVYNAAENGAFLTHVSAEFYGEYRFFVLALAILISAPVTEEVLCRGILVNTLKRSFSPVWAIVISSLIFGAMHLMAGGVMLAVGATAMGLVLAVIYEKTGSLYAAILAHAAANLPDFILYSSPELGAPLHWGGAAVCFAAFIVCFWCWRRIPRDAQL